MRRYVLILLGCVCVAMPAPGGAADAPKITFGGEIRMRGYRLDNMFDFNDSSDRDQWTAFRLRTSAHARIDAGEGITGFIQIANQNYGEGVSASMADQWEEDNKSNKFFVDNAYIHLDHLSGLPVSARLGRQNLKYGSGFVLFDGQSQYASTSIYFDGVKVIAHIHERVRLDLLWFKDQENNRDDESNDDITLAGAYLLSSQQHPFDSQELYLLNREDELLGKNIQLYGIRLAGTSESGLAYSAECGIQRGDFTESVDQEALGVKLDLSYTLRHVTARPSLILGYVALSGDDPATTGVNEAWDVFYGGWPQFGDLLAWKYVNTGGSNVISRYDPGYNAGSSTGGEAVYSNVTLATVGFGTTLFDKFSARATWSKLTIDETVDGIDDDFGDYYQLTLKYPYSPNLSFAVYAAMIDPGAAFEEGADPAVEAFWETRFFF